MPYPKSAVSIVDAVRRDVRRVFPRQPRERLAELMAVSVHTAKGWLDRHLSEDTARKIAAELLDEFDRQERKERPLLRATLEWAAYGGQRGETKAHADKYPPWTRADSADCVSGALASRALGDACSQGF
jgi:hypothetical protein